MNNGLQTIKMISYFVFLTLQFLVMIEGGIINVLHQENVGVECHIDPDMCRNAVSFNGKCRMITSCEMRSCVIELRNITIICQFIWGSLI